MSQLTDTPLLLDSSLSAFSEDNVDSLGEAVLSLHHAVLGVGLQLDLVTMVRELSGWF